VSGWWSRDYQSLTSKALTNTATRRSTQSKGKAKSYNPYAGNAAAWQFDEDLEDFLERLPPATTSAAVGPWLWIANPFSQERLSTPDWTTFTADGEEILQEWTRHKSQVEAQRGDKSKISTARVLTKDRVAVEKKLLNLASELKCTSGKV
jgi:hypothetical protein